MPNEALIKELKGKFKRVIVLYDNDFNNENNPGQMMAEKICNEHTLINICIPSEYCSKDISDLIRDHGVDVARNFINTSLPHSIQSNIR